jgi:uncharacterized protein (TIGR02266 family)
VSDTQELAAAAVQSAREARRVLAEAMRDLSTLDVGLAEDLAFAVAALFRVELDAIVGDRVDTEALRDRLREAAAVVSGVLSRLHAPELAAGLDLAGPALAKTLAALYPARAGLERVLSQQAADAEPPSQADPSPPAMLFERPLAASFARPRDASPVVVRHDDVARSERPTTRDPLGARRQQSDPPERPSARLRRNAVALVADGEVGMIDQHGQSGAQPSDRRERGRAEFTVDIGLHSTTQFFAGISGDLSEGGLFVATYIPQPIGTELSVSFVLPGGASISTPAIVAWIRQGQDSGAEPGMGLRFFRLEDKERAAIERFLKIRPPMLYQP